MMGSRSSGPSWRYRRGPRACPHGHEEERGYLLRLADYGDKYEIDDDED